MYRQSKKHIHKGTECKSPNGIIYKISDCDGINVRLVPYNKYKGHIKVHVTDFIENWRYV